MEASAPAPGLALPTPSPSPSALALCDYSEWSPTWVLIPLVYLLAFVLGSLGNALVLWLYLGCSVPRLRRACPVLPRVPPPSSSSSSSSSSPAPSRPGRSLTDSLIASLAAADLAFVATLPLWAAYTAQGYHWPFGRPLCKLSSYLVALNMYASVFSLTGLSVERYWVVAGRGAGARRRGGRLGAWLVAGVWALAGVLALPALLLRTVREVQLGEDGEEVETQDGGGGGAHFQDQGVEASAPPSHNPLQPDDGDAFHPHYSCVMDFSGLVGADDPSERDRAELLWTAALGLKSTLLGFLLPLGILLLCYGSLGRLLSRHFGKRAGERRRQRRLLRVIATLVLAFFLCWLPYHANKILDILVSLEVLPTSCAFERVLVLAHPYATCLAYANSCLNPLLYACCDPSFRRRCQGLLGRCQGTGGREEEKGKEASRSSGVQSGSESKQKSKREGEQDKVRRCKDQPDAEQYSETGHYSTLTLH